MGYATKQDLIDRFGQAEIVQLTDRTNSPPSAIDDTVLNRALADADGDIDAALNGRYVLPLASIPKVLVRVATNLARYYLYEDTASENVTRRYQDEKKLLDAVAAGKMTLGIDAANQSVAPDAGSVAFNDSRRVMGADKDGVRDY